MTEAAGTPALTATSPEASSMLAEVEMSIPAMTGKT